ncbi:gliding motility lipoprotein GldD [Marinifilum fragile]|uniref:gliding motility lipoprotein GldD n=1 Tax=Marinifilum fragile TaxID=570161 RepID=UPI002AA76E0E|nr:gliding motility lipoprotein GldD [Marinifilum fragile]
MKLTQFVSYTLIAFITIGFTSCKEKYTPKPKGYFRIDLPEKQYEKWSNNYPYSFDKLSIANVSVDKSKGAEKYWLNIQYPDYKATIHLSYKSVNGNVEEYLEDSRKMAYKHSIKADAIGEQAFLNQDKNVYALIYRIKGNAASSVQFVATDSTKHFLRGALYFKEHPNQDSLAPVIQYIDKDVVKLIESLKWSK